MKKKSNNSVELIQSQLPVIGSIYLRIIFLFYRKSWLSFYRKATFFLTFYAKTPNHEKRWHLKLAAVWVHVLYHVGRGIKQKPTMESECKISTIWLSMVLHKNLKNILQVNLPNTDEVTLMTMTEAQMTVVCLQTAEEKETVNDVMFYHSAKPLDVSNFKHTLSINLILSDVSFI